MHDDVLYKLLLPQNVQRQDCVRVIVVGIHVFYAYALAITCTFLSLQCGFKHGVSQIYLLEWHTNLMQNYYKLV